MKLLIFLIFLFSFSVTSSFLSKNTRHKRAMGGESAAPGQFPFAVSISLSGNRHLCGGSIIDEKRVLTAAQCVFNHSASELTVLAGTNLLDTGGIFYSVSEIRVHPDYTNHTYYFNDIAVVTISGFFEFNDLIRNISIRPIEGNYQLFTLIGWGYEYGYRNELQYVKVLHVTHEDCEKLIQLQYVFYPMRPGQFCASSFNGVTPCEGDLGGPLVDDGHLLGIVSYSPSTCHSGVPYVYTNVAYYEDWIGLPPPIKIRSTFI